MYNLLTTGHYQTFRNALASAKNKIHIISPFVGMNTAKELAKVINETDLECILITRFYREDFINRASNIDALKILLESGVKLYALRDLHTKLYLVDDNFGLFGSANFTLSGFAKNHELQILIADEDHMLSELSNYFKNLLIQIQSSDESEITRDLIDNEIISVKDLQKMKSKDIKKGIVVKNNKKYGAIIKAEEYQSEDTIERIISANSNDIDNDIWLKFEGSALKRLNSKENHSKDRVIINETHITSFPRNPSGISSGDFIYIAAVSSDKKGNNCSMIVGRARTKGYNSSNVAKQDLIDKYAWMENYPKYIELYDVEMVDAPIEDCISMNDMINILGRNTYPSTKSNSNSNGDIFKIHLQKSHLRLSKDAKEFLDKELERLFAIYGSEK